VLSAPTQAMPEPFGLRSLSSTRSVSSYEKAETI